MAPENVTAYERRNIDFMKSYRRSLALVIPKLKCFWLLLFFVGVATTIFGATECQDSLAKELFIYGGGAIVGFSSSAYFSRKEQFLLRGVTDKVYLVKNHCCIPIIYKLADRETLLALGGIWHQVQNVSERFLSHLYHCFGKKKTILSLKEAKLYRLSNEESVFAVMLDVRYGVPSDTLNFIWGDPPAVNTASISDVDKWLPGGDLVSTQYWPQKDRDHR